MGQAWAEGKGDSLQRAAIARTADGSWSKCYAAIVYVYRLNASMNKQKNCTSFEADVVPLYSECCV